MKFLTRREDAPRFEVEELHNIKHVHDGREICPERVFRVRDPSGRFNSEKGGVIGHIVIDNTSWSHSELGKGGTAMYPGCSLEDTIKKAHVMTRKQIPCHPFGVATKYPQWGGAKGGIDFARFTDGTVDSELVARGFVQATYEHGIVGKYYLFGLDVGTNEQFAAVACNQLNSLVVSTGKPRMYGGVEYDKNGFAGRGTVIVAEAMCAERGFDLRDPMTTAVIEGFGAVGTGIARGLLEGERSCRVVAVSDADAHGTPFCMYSSSGLDLSELLGLKQATGNIADYVKSGKAGFISMGATWVNCDVLFLASSRTKSIDLKNARQVSCRVVAQGANLGVTEDAEEILWERGILTLPDYLTNYASSASALVEFDLSRYSYWEEDPAIEAWKYVESTMRHNTRIILDTVAATGLSPRRVGEVMTASELAIARAVKMNENNQKAAR